MLVEKDKAYLLHLKPYRETSALVDMLTVSHGRVRFVVKGIKSAKSQKMALLQPCQMLEISYLLKPNLSMLNKIELIDNQLKPNIKHFMLYQYAHELLTLIAPEQLEITDVFHAYQQFLMLLCKEEIQLALRTLEISLIDMFLHLPDLTIFYDEQSKEKPIVEDNQYYFYIEHGVFANQQELSGVRVRGETLIALDKIKHDRTDEISAKKSQPLVSHLIKILLADKTLKTRKIYQSLQKYI